MTINQQEGQHPLTGHRAANFRLLANQWAECRLVTQWHHGCRAMRRSVCNAGTSNGGQSLCIQISRERSVPPANILIPLERQLIALQLCRWQFLYNGTLQQPFRPVLSKLSTRRQILVTYPHFWGSWGRRRTLVDGSLESPCRVLVKRNWTSCSISYGWGATRQNVSRLAAIIRG